MDIERKLKKKLTGKFNLKTPVLKLPLEVEGRDDTVIFRPGDKKDPRKISWSNIAKVIEFLWDKGWVDIGAAHHNNPKVDTLEDHIDDFNINRRGYVNYIAAFLEHGKFVKIKAEPGEYSKIKLLKSSLR